MLFALATQCEQKEDKQHETNKPNANLTHTQTYPMQTIFLQLVWGFLFGWLGHKLSCIGLARVFRYQDVAVGNAKWSQYESWPTRGPKAYGFVFRWNIGWQEFQCNKNTYNLCVNILQTARVWSMIFSLCIWVSYTYRTVTSPHFFHSFSL